MTDNEKQTAEGELEKELDTEKADSQPQETSPESLSPEEEDERDEKCAEGDTASESPEDESLEEKEDALTEEAKEAASDAGAEGAEAEPKRFSEKMAARKQAKQDKKSEEYRQKIAELEDRAKRQLAEFENFRRRSDKEKQMMFETGAKSVIEKILPVIDNFERGLATVPAEKAEDPFVDGMGRVYRQMLSELEKMDVKPIEAVGKEFDPALHNAVMQVESEEYDAGVVAQELQKGYTYRDSVVRHSMVAVVKE